MNQNKATLALDVGEKRIGVAVADGIVRIARPLGAVIVDGREMAAIVGHIANESARTVVIGYPRNQSGETTAQTSYVEAFKDKLSALTDVQICFQDESLTSVMAEDRLRTIGKPYARGDIDAQAAVIILEDFLENSNGRI